MQTFHRLFVVAVCAIAAAIHTQAQPVIIQPNDLQKMTTGSGVSNLRLIGQGAGGTEITVAMDYTHDGLQGPTATILLVVEKKDQKSVSAWFGSDAVTVGIGRGPIATKIKYFSDEPGVPAGLTTDRIRVVIRNESGRGVIGGNVFLKTINWGVPGAGLGQAEVVSNSNPGAGQGPRRNAAKAQTEAQEREEAERKKQESQQKAEEKRLADEQRRAERQAKAEAESRRKAEAKSTELAQVQETARQEAEAAERARLQETQRKEAEARLAEEKRLADERARAENESRKATEAATQAKAPETAKPELVLAATVSAVPASQTIASHLKTKVTNVDVVNRSVDRSQMTIGVEFEYRDDLGPKAMIGVDVLSSNDSAASGYFSSKPVEIGRSRRNFVLVPVRFEPPPSELSRLSSFATDKVMVYLQQSPSASRMNIFPATMLLLWRPAGSAPETSAAPTSNRVEIDDFKQNDLHSGYVSVQYQLLGGPGRLRVRVSDSKNPESSAWFQSLDKPAQVGRGLQLLELEVNPDAKVKSQTFTVDTIEIELIDSKGVIVARLSRKVPMTWAKP